MSRLLVYAGPNGSGKSSLREALGETTDVVIDPDQIARSINPKNPRAADRQAGIASLTLFRESVQAGRSLSIETTLSGQTVISRLREAKAAGLEIGLYYVALADVETNVGRVALRAAAGGHYIEPDVVRRRAKSSLRNLPAAIALADRTVIFDNSGERHRRILEIDHGTFRILQELPAWLAGILPAIKANFGVIFHDNSGSAGHK